MPRPSAKTEGVRRATNIASQIFLALLLLLLPACGDGDGGGGDTNPGREDPGLDY